MNKKKVLIVYQTPSPFINNDIDILSIFFKIRIYQFKPVNTLIKTSISLLKQFFFLIYHIWEYDAVYIWFADYFSFLPVVLFRIFGKKAFLVIGGYDVCRIKGVDYGVFNNKLRGFCAITSIKLCTVNITVSKYIDRKVKFIAPKSVRRLIYNCVNINYSNSDKNKENLVLMVAHAENNSSFYIKGIDNFIELARQVPDYKFVINGLVKDKILPLLSDIPTNLYIFGLIPHSDLKEYYSKALFYCQLSRSESFGITVAESMLFECIPLVTNIGGLPEIVGDKKYIIVPPMNDIEHYMKKLISENTLLEKQKRKERINSLFSFESRKENLILLMNEHINFKIN
jgi:glycosyltransferase involved in cell wall biosynthesis